LVRPIWVDLWVVSRFVKQAPVRGRLEHDDPRESHIDIDASLATQYCLKARLYLSVARREDGMMWNW
jgi:hypothetical protein